MVQRDNLDENGAAFRMRIGDRSNLMIALSLGQCKLFPTCRAATIAPSPRQLIVARIG
jgi:hypothetical protein